LKEYKPYPCQGEQVVHRSGLRGLRFFSVFNYRISANSFLPWILSSLE
jgi:hypothetical protein